MVKIRRVYFEGRYGQVHAYITGEARPGVLPLYCAHQSPKSGLEFESFMRAAGRERLVIAPDYPGYGMSDTPPSEDLATIELYAETLWAVADQLGHGKIDLFGNHTGAKVIAAMAMDRPEAVGSLVMISAAILTDEERAAFGDFFTPIPLDEAGTRYTTMWKRIIERRGPGTTLEMLGRSMMQNLLGGEEYEWGHAAAFAWGAPFERALKTLKHPITILNPTDDLTEVTRRAAPWLKNGEVLEKPEWGYNFMDVWPEESAGLILSCLERGAAPV
jgi:pimeloyl-ACP methyl ester carboxylesterase